LLDIQINYLQQYDEIKVKYDVVKELFNENEKIQKGETVIVGLYNIISDGIIKNIEKGNVITIKLNKPVLGYKDDKVIILRNINKRWKIFAIGKLL